jgi:hypothetical protein
MKHRAVVIALPLLVTACATPVNPLDSYEELDATTILDAPTPGERNVAPENRESVARGEYLVELLARILHQLACKIAQGFDWLKDFPSERNNGVYFRGRKILQAIKD